MKFCELTKFCYFLLIGLLKENQNACRDKNKLIIHFQQNMTLNMPIITISTPLQAGTPTL